MIHPPDPDSRRNVHVAMKVSIMTDGPGGLHFTQAVQTGAYSTTTVYPEPFGYNAQNLPGVTDGSSVNNMVTWPRSESSQTQTDNVLLPIIETPANTSKDSGDPRLAMEAPVKIHEGSEIAQRSQHHDQPVKHRHRHHHHHRHRRSKSAGSGERKSPSSLSSLKPSSSIYTEDVNYIYDQFFKLDSVKNMPFTYVDHLGPTFPLLPTNVDLNSRRSPIIPAAYNRPIDDPLPGYADGLYTSVGNHPDSVYCNERMKCCGSDEILINTFSDENKPSSNSNCPLQLLPSGQRDVILEKEATLKQTLVVRGSDNDVIHKFDNFDKTKSIIGRPGDGVTRVREIETTKNDDLPLLCTPRFDENSKDTERGVTTKPLPDIVAVLMEPIMKLTEQLALAKNIINEPYDLKANEEANLEIKTTLSAWKRDLSKKQPIHLKSDEDSKLGPPSAPLETLINDVGVESKEIQTIPEKFDISTATEEYYGSKSPIRNIISAEPTAILRDSPLETLLDDVGLESKQIQTLPEKFHAGTSTDDLILPQKQPYSAENLNKIPQQQLLDSEMQHPILERQNVPEKIPRSFIFQKSIIHDQEKKEESVLSHQYEKCADVNKHDPVTPDLAAAASTIDDEKYRGPFAVKDSLPGSRKSKSTILLKPTVPPPLPPSFPFLDFCTNENAIVYKNPRITSNYGGFVEQQQQQQEPPDQVRPQLGVSSSSNRRPASSVEIFQLLTKDGAGKKYGMLGVDSDLYSEHIYETPAYPPLRRDLYTLPELPESPRSDDRRTVGSDKDVKTTGRVTPSRSGGDDRSKTMTTSNNTEQYSDGDGYQSINSERSSISGIVKLIDLKAIDASDLIEENILDYSQEEISPIGKITEFNESNAGDEETPNRNSLASETSLKADESFEMYYSEVPRDSNEPTAMTPVTVTHSTPILSLERSFDEIMQMAAGRSSRISAALIDQHIQRCYPKLYNLSQRPDVDTPDQEPRISGSRLNNEPLTNEVTHDNHEIGSFSGVNAAESMIDQSNSSSSHSTLPLMGDIAVKRHSSIVRTAELVIQNVDRAEMQFVETTDADTSVVQPVYVSNKRDGVADQIPANLTVKPLVKRSFKQTSL